MNPRKPTSIWLSNFWTAKTLIAAGFRIKIGLFSTSNLSSIWTKFIKKIKIS